MFLLWLDVYNSCGISITRFASKLQELAVDNEVEPANSQRPSHHSARVTKNLQHLYMSALDQSNSDHIKLRQQ